MRDLARLNHFFWKYKRLFVPGLLCAAISAGFQVAVPGIVRRAVDAVPRFVALHSGFDATIVQSYLFWDFFFTLALYAGLIILLSVISGVFSFLTRQTVVVASRHIEYDLRGQLFEHLQTLPQRFYHRYPTGDVITRATSDIELIRRYIGPAIMYTVRALTLVGAALTVMLAISPKLTAYAMLPMPFLALAIFFVARLEYSRSRALQEQNSTLTSRVQEALAGVRVLKAYTREDAENKTFGDESETYRKRVMSLALVGAAWRPVFLVLVGLSQIIVVWIGGRLVMQGEISLGNIAEFLIYVAIMTWPVASFGFVITMVQRASASMNRLGEVFDTKPAIADTEHTDESITEVAGAIAFRNVSYHYVSNDPEAEVPQGDGAPPLVLKDLSFEVPAGSTLAIVGRTGAGKSTLVQMIPRLLEPTSGTVEIDGRDVREVPLETLRGSVGMVPQDVFLFSETVGENIAFGALGASQEDIEEAAREAELLDNVRDFPEGFETFVGERGITLSGGQKQRASIARALLRRPSILILDDALSAVDTTTESRILGHLRQHYGRRTVVIVTHRLSAAQDADLILVLDEGRIVERGGHQELVGHDGLYASLWHKQQLEAELASL